MKRRDFLSTGAVGVAGLAALTQAAGSEVAKAVFLREADLPATNELYNGIRVPPSWPPKDRAFSLEPMPAPYLLSPPAIIPIDIGRQLFVDDFLIEKTTLRRTYHQAQYHPANPVLRPDKPWEKSGKDPTAMVFSDGVWYDPQDRLFKMWYLGGMLR